MAPEWSPMGLDTMRQMFNNPYVQMYWAIMHKDIYDSWTSSSYEFWGWVYTTKTRGGVVLERRVVLTNLWGHRIASAWVGAMSADGTAQFELCFYPQPIEGILPEPLPIKAVLAVDPLDVMREARQAVSRQVLAEFPESVVRLIVEDAPPPIMAILRRHTEWSFFPPTHASGI
jgi:hypothetical protein